MAQQDPLAQALESRAFLIMADAFAAVVTPTFPAPVGAFTDALAQVQAAKLPTSTDLVPDDKPETAFAQLAAFDARIGAAVKASLTPEDQRYRGSIVDKRVRAFAEATAEGRANTKAVMALLPYQRA